jgi:hypothetical protein
VLDGLKTPKQGRGFETQQKMLSCATKNKDVDLCCGDGGSKVFCDSRSDAICVKYLRVVDSLNFPWMDVSRMWLWSVIPSEKLMKMKSKLRALRE